MTSFPEGGWGWMVTLGGAVVHMISVGCGRSFGIIYLELLDRFQGSAAATVLVWSICDAFSLIPGPVASLIADRFTCRKAVMVGGVLACLGYVTSGFVSQLYQLYITLSVFVGVGTCLMCVPTFIIIGQYFDKKKGKAMGLATIGTGIGSMVFPPFVVLLIQEYGYSGAMILLGGICLNGVVMGALFRPVASTKFLLSMETTDDRKPYKTTSDKYNENITDNNINITLEEEILQPATLDVSQDKNSCKNNEFNENYGEQNNKHKESLCSRKSVLCMKRWKLLKNKDFGIYLLTMFAMPSVCQIVITFTPSLATERDSITDQQKALLITLGGATDTIGRFFFGFVFDIKFLRGNLRLVHSLLGISLSVTTISLGLVPSYNWIAVLVGFWGFFEGGFHGQRATILYELLPLRFYSLAFGILTSVQGTGNIITTVLGGVLKDVTGTYTACFIYPGSFSLLMNLLCLGNNIVTRVLMRKKVSRKEEKPI